MQNIANEFSNAISIAPDTEVLPRTMSAWVNSILPLERASVVLNSESIPDGRVILTMNAPGSQLKETRLLEFRAAIK